MKYLLENHVQGRIGRDKFRTTIIWRNGAFITDEPEKIGGKELGPDPHTLLLTSLISCTVATLRMYIDHKQLDIPEVVVEANLRQRINASTGEISTTIYRWLSYGETEVEPAVKTRLMEIADSCPISKILKANISIETA